MRVLKFLAIAAGSSLLLLAAGLLALRLLYPPEKVKAIALEKLEAALGREVRIAQASIGLRSVELGGVEVSEARDFKAGTFLSVDKISVRPLLRPLILEKRLELAELALVKPRIALIRGKDGVLNASTLGEGAKSKSAGRPSGPAKPGVALMIASLRVEGGKLGYEDKASGSLARLEDLDLRWKGFRLEGLSDLELSCAYAGGSKAKPFFGRLEFDGNINPAGGVPAKMTLKARKLVVKHEVVTLELKGTVADLSAPQAEVQFQASGLKKDGMKLPELNGTFKGGLRGDRVSISEARLGLGPLAAKIHGTVLTAKTPAGLDLRVEAKDLDLKELAGLAGQLPVKDPAGKATIALTVTGDVESPVFLGTVALKGASFSAQGNAFSELDASASFTPAKVEVAGKGKWNGTAASAAIKALDYRGTKPRLDISVDLASLDLGAIAKAKQQSQADGPSGKAESARESRPIDIAGRLTIGRVLHPNFNAEKLELILDLKGLASDLSGLNGVTQFRLGPGRFEDLKELGAQNPLAKAVLMPLLVLQRAAAFVKIPLFPAFDRARFKELTGDYVVKDGVMSIKESHLDSDPAYATMTGSADLAGDRIDLRVSMKMAAHLGLKLSGPVGFTVKGSLSDPKVKLDAASILKQPGVEKAADELLKQGEKLLRGLFNK